MGRSVGTRAKQCQGGPTCNDGIASEPDVMTVREITNARQNALERSGHRKIGLHRKTQRTSGTRQNLRNPPCLHTMKVKTEVTDGAAHFLKRLSYLMLPFKSTIEQHKAPAASSRKFAADSSRVAGGLV